MTCRPSETGRLEKLALPARIGCGVLGALLLVGSFLDPAGLGTAMAAAGGLVIFAAVLLPVLTDFEIDALGIRAKASLLTRRQRIEGVCLGEKSQLSSLLAMVGIEPNQIDSLVEEAVKETCRRWRGRVVEELVRQLLICRAMQLVKLAAEIGAPYRIVLSDIGAYGSNGAAFAALDNSERMMVALVLHHEMDKRDVAAMLDVDAAKVEAALRRLPSPSGASGRSA